VLKVCVVGAGAIGGFLGTRLAAADGVSVAALARGATLVALRDHGWRLQEGAILLQAPAATASDDPRALGPQDLVIVTVKGRQCRPSRPPLRPSSRRTPWCYPR
jgi:2-dehydropantoate 2-reductase